MQKVVFTRFGVGRGQEGAANLGAADFTTAKNSGKMGLLRGIMQSKAANSMFSGLRVSSLSLSLSLS